MTTAAPAYPLIRSGGGRPAVGALATVAGTTAVGVVVAVSGGGLPIALMLAGLVVVAAWIEPLTCILPYLLIEEYYRGAPVLSAAPITLTWGHQFYETLIFGVPMPLILLSLGTAMALLRRNRANRRMTRFRSLEIFAVALAAIALALEVPYSGAHGSRIASAAIRETTPWLTLLLAYAVCVLRIRAGKYRLLVSLLAATVLAKATLALVVEAISGGYTFEGQSHLIFYDAATPAIAVAVVLYLMAARRERLDWRRLGLLLAAFLVVLFSFRRSIWVMLPVGLLWIPLLTRDARAALRVVVAVAVGALAVALLPAAAVNGQTSRITAAFNVAAGRSTHDTAAQHEQDITEGIRLARAHPIDGLGVDSPQAPGLVNTRAKTVYVHNELLQEWLRFGIVGFLLTLGLLLSLLCRAFVVLRHSDEHVTRVAATWALVLPLPLMTAPFVGTTNRWPILVAVAASLLAVGDDPRNNHEASV